MKIIENPSLKDYTTLNIGGKASKGYILEAVEDVEKIASLLSECKLPHIILGGGSNVLIEDEDLDVILVQDMLNAQQEIKIIKEDKDFAWIEVSSGKFLPLLVRFCAKHGFSGLEGLVGIPGRVGGALAMNVGAFKCSISEVFENATIFSPNFGIKTYTKEDVLFNYRSFKLKEKVDYAIHLGMVLKLKKSTSQQVEDTIQENLARKRASQPLKEKTAGCAFKNPENTAAGKLIEDVGLKGYRLNDMGFSSQHANFLVNYAKGTYKDAMTLIHLAQEKVFQEFGVKLETEIKIFNQEYFKVDRHG